MGDVAVGGQAIAHWRVVFAGYYGFGNLGDEALLHVVLRWLRKYPQLEPWVLSANPEQTRQQHGVHAVSRASAPSVLYALSRARALIFGGGGLLQDATSRRSLWYYLSLIHWARRLKVPVLLIGQGLGPLSARGELQTAKVLRRVDYIGVRDEHSLRLLQRWNLSQAHLGPDLALCLSPPPRSERPAVPLLGLALVSPAEAAHETALRRMAAAIERVQRELELTPIFLACHRQDLRFGIALNQRVPALTVLPLSQDVPEHHLALFSEFKVIWGSRLHALALATMAGVPCAALGYDPKVERFAASVAAHPGCSMPYWLLQDLDPDELVQATAELLQDRQMGSHLQVAAKAMQMQAEAALADAGRCLEGLLGLQAPAPTVKVEETA